MDENVDILVPPFFTTNGTIKTREQALNDGDWIGTFNLWILTSNPEPSIIYQQRSLSRAWSPGLLDVAAGGHYQAGEQLIDGLREVEEELGKHYDPEAILYLGRKVYVGLDTQDRAHNNIVEVYMTTDDSPLESYRLQKEELNGLCICPVRELLRVHTDKDYSFRTQLLDVNGENIVLEITHDSFPPNWDNYHYKMAVLADRYFQGEKHLVY